MRSSRPEPGSDLPAPYENPWRRLGVDLSAVVASIGLRLREFWRRNREGDLPRPAFWPTSLGPVFWPGLLALGLAATVLLVGRLLGPAELATPASPPPGIPPAAPPAVAASAPVVDREATEGDPAPGVVAGEISPLLAPPEIRPPASAVALDERDSPATTGDPIGAIPQDPLLVELAGEEGAAWLLAVESFPAERRLRLRLAAGFAALPESQRRHVAEAWQGRARDLGYEQLELLGAEDRLLARSARVGSGMILLDSPPLDLR